MEINEISHNVAAWSLSRILEQQSYIAQNIANANITNYQAVRADFSEVMSQAKNLQISPGNLNEYLKNGDFSPILKYDNQGVLTDKVELDKEVLALLNNSNKYNGIVELLNRNFGLMKMAINSRR